MFGSISRISRPRRARVVPALGVAAVALVIGGSAQAADMAMRYKAPPYIAAQVFSWSGFYIGGHVSYSDGRDRLLEYFTAGGAFTGFEKRHSVDGLTGGGFAGANYQTGYWVFGVEGDIEGGRLRGGWTDVAVGGAGVTKLDVQGSLRGRIGIASDKILFYGTGGAAFGNISHSYSNLVTGVVETTTEVRTGWTAGGGVEVAVAPNWMVRGEYRYTDYGLSRYDSVTSFPGLTGTQNVRLNSVRIGAAYKF